MSLAEYRTKKNGPSTAVEVFDTLVAPSMTEEEIAELQRLRDMDIEDTIRRMKVKARPGRDPREFEWRALHYQPGRVSCAQDIEIGGTGAKMTKTIADASLPPIVERDDSRYLPAPKVASTAGNRAKNLAPAPAPTPFRPSLPPLRTNSIFDTSA